MDMSRSSEMYDVVIVGGGPAGLATAIKLKQLSLKSKIDVRVCVIEKATQFGGHSVSGACINPRSLDELIPNWRTSKCPLKTEVVLDCFEYLTQNGSLKLPVPTFIDIHNYGNYVGSLGHLVLWLSEEAEKLGVELYPGVAVAEVLYHRDGSVKGVASGDLGVGKDGSPKSTFCRGFEFHSKATVFAEGCRGHLTKEIISRYHLNHNKCPQTYGIGIKELWEVRPENHIPGKVSHFLGWPMNPREYGGSFVYHYGENLVSLGIIIALNYQNPFLSPYWELQKLKTHPHFRKLLEGGVRIGYAARAISEGGYQAIPQLNFPGGVLVGDSAGFVNVPKIKAVHAAIKSGILAAESIHQVLSENPTPDSALTFEVYQNLFRNSWLHDELYRARNIRPFHFYCNNFPLLALYTVIFYGCLGSREPFTFTWNHKDNEKLKAAAICQKITYPKPDGKLVFDLMSSVALTGTNHEGDQPPHLKLLDDNVPLDINLKIYGGPEQFYCPAGVYEFTESEKGNQFLTINAQNCIHCKTCDIKDPNQNIKWVVPESGGGPSYSGM